MKIKISSLSKNEDFKYLLNRKKISSKYLTIFFGKLSKKKPSYLNISFITKKKLGNAVLRNKIKRRLRSIMNEAIKEITINNKYSYLFMAKKNVFDGDYKLIKKDIFETLKKVR